MGKVDKEKLSRDLDNLEKLRRSVERTMIVFAVLTVVISVAVFLTFAYLDGSTNVFYVSLLPIILGAAISKKKKRPYKKLYNEVIVRSVFERYFDIEEFNSDYGVPVSAIKNTRMIKIGNEYESNDFLSGKYKGTNFYQSDVCIREVVNTGKATQTITYFKGRWMIFDFNKNFNCDLLIHEKNFKYADHRKNLFSKEFEKIQFENTQFNKVFESYTDNEQEAFYIITPHIMDAMMKLREKTDGALIFCFCRNQVHIGVNNMRDAFEPPIFHPIDVETAIADISEDIDLITRFVDELNLDRKVYKV